MEIAPSRILTPMLDMVFQLITFFMLVLNVKAAYIDTTLSLPIVGSAKPVDDKGLEELMVINVNKEGHVKAYGKRCRRRTSSD